MRYLKCLLPLVFLATPAMAEPSSSITRLMATPTSLFSFGLVRLQDSLSESTAAPWVLPAPIDAEKKYEAIVSYDQKTNLILVSLSDPMLVDRGWPLADECRLVMERLRRQAYVDPQTGKPRFGMATSTFAGLFSPIGHDNTSLADAIEELDGRIELRLFRLDGSCSAPLLGSAFQIQSP